MYPQVCAHMFFWLTHCDASPSKRSQHLHRQRTSSYTHGHDQKIGVHFRSSSCDHSIPRVLQGPLSPQFSNCFHLGRHAYSKMLRRYVYNLMNARGFSGGASGKESAGQGRRHEIWVQSRVGKIPWRRKRQPTPVLLPGKSHGRKSMMGYSPQRCSVRENLATEHTATSILYILDVITSSAYNRKYFLPFYRLPVYYIYSFLCCAKLLV